MRAGVMAARSGDFEGALSLYDRALQVAPANPLPLIYRGLTLQGMNELEGALASYEGAIALKPDFGGAHLNRGNVLKELKRPQEALASYEQAIALKPDFVEAHANRGKRAQGSEAAAGGAYELRAGDCAQGGFRGGALQTAARYCSN